MPSARSAAPAATARTAVTRLVAAAACLLLAACGSTLNAAQTAGSAGSALGAPGAAGSVAGASGSGSGTGSGPGSGTGAGTPATGADVTTGAGATLAGAGSSSALPSSTGSAPVAVGGPPVSAALPPVPVGFLAIQPSSGTNTAQLYGASFADQGDPAAEVQAITAYVNAHGGLAGRPMKAYFEYRQSSDGDAEDEAHCTKFTQDDHVFAVVSNGSPNTQCYAKAHTLILADEAYTATQLNQGSPYVWDMGLPFQEAGFVAEVDGLAGQHYFAPSDKVGIISFDRADIHTVFTKAVLPRIRRYFSGLVDNIYVDDTDNSTVAQGTSQAELKFSSEGINRVFFLAPGGGVPLEFMNYARSQAYYPKYGISTYDVPLLLTSAHQTDQMAGSVGVGFDMAVDLTDSADSYPYPGDAAEKRCKDAVAAAFSPSYRGASTQIGYLCDGAFFLQAAASLVHGPLTASAWGAAADGIGRAFQSTWTLPDTTEFLHGRHSGSVAYRWLSYDTASQAYLYASGVKRMTV